MVGQRTWPRDRIVGFATQDSGVYWFLKGSGRLTLYPHVLRCDFKSGIPDFHSVVHRGSVVHIYHQRLAPIWNVSVCVDDGDRCIFAITWLLKALIGHLKDAGFEPVVHKTWTFAGWRYFRPS